MRTFTEHNTNKDFEDLFPWERRISEFTEIIINKNLGAFPSLIKEVEEKIDNSPKRKNHILSAYYVQYTDQLLTLKDSSHSDHYAIYFFLLEQEKELARKLMFNYEHDNDQKLNVYRDEILEILELRLNEVHWIASREDFEDDERTYCYGEDLVRIEEYLVFRIDWIFYTAVHYIDLIDWLELKINETESLRRLEEDIQQSSVKNKFKWTGTASQFGFFMDLFIQGGYMEKPASSFPKQALIFMEHFEIDTTLATLAKELNEKTNSLTALKRKKVDIPPKHQL